MRTLEECRSILGLKRGEFADRLGIERKTYYNAMKRTPSKTVLILANLMADRLPPAPNVETIIRVAEVDPSKIANDMAKVHELRNLTPPVSWKEIANLAGCFPDRIQRRYYRWKAVQSLLNTGSQPPISRQSMTAITPT